MVLQKQTDLSDPSVGNNFLLSMSPFTRTAALMSELQQSYLEMFAATTSLALKEISTRQVEVLRAMSSPALLAFWPQPYPTNSPDRADPGRTWLELAFKPPFAMPPQLGNALPHSDFGVSFSSGRPDVFDPGRRSSAVVIDFPDRRKAGS